jgi:type 1 glutamine amidotransferase
LRPDRRLVPRLHADAQGARRDIHPVLVIDRTLLAGTDKMKSDVASYRNPLPLAWWHTFDGGREYYIALGHKKEDYENPILYGLIENGIVWAMTK